MMLINAPRKEEIWKEIKDFPGYEISSWGNIRSYWKHHGPKASSLEKIVQKKGFGYKDSDGYHRVGLRKNGKSYCKKVARLVLEAFDGPCPIGCQTRHLDGIRDNNCIDNLRWGTIAENTADKIKHGNHLKGGYRGEKHWKAKLSVEKVLEIRELYKDGLSLSELGRRYGVSHTHIGFIVNRKSWRYIL